MGTDILKYVSLCKHLGFLFNLIRTDRYHPHDSLVILFNTKFTKLELYYCVRSNAYLQFSHLQSIMDNITILQSALSPFINLDNFTWYMAAVIGMYQVVWLCPIKGHQSMMK